MKNRIALACIIASLIAPALAGCGKNADETEAVVPPEEILQPVLPPAKEENEEETEGHIPAETVTKPEEVKPAAARYLKTKTDSLNVRAGAGGDFPVLGSVEKNILMKYAGRTGNWYETRFQGKTAFVHADYASIAELERGSEKTEKIIDEGLNVLGAPYVYGATRLHDGKGNFFKNFSDRKFDCSSLMQFMFFKGANVLLDVTTRTQILQGKEVKGDLKRGDLLFFTNASRKNNTGIERVGHVALYLGGNYILHTASDYAKIEQISPVRWSYYLGARRMF